MVWLGRDRLRNAAKPGPRFQEPSLGDVLPQPVNLEVRLPAEESSSEGRMPWAVAELVRALRC